MNVPNSIFPSLIEYVFLFTVFLVIVDGMAVMEEIDRRYQSAKKDVTSRPYDYLNYRQTIFEQHMNEFEARLNDLKLYVGRSPSLSANVLHSYSDATAAPTANFRPPLLGSRKRSSATAHGLCICSLVSLIT